MVSGILYALLVILFVLPSGSGFAQTALNPATKENLPKRIEAWVPIRPITHGPSYHWFGYYDKLQFDPTGRYVLGMEVNFEDGSRFIFLNRWRISEYRASNPDNPFDTRMLTAAPDGSDIRIVDDSGYTSHFIWRDNTHIFAWTKLPSYGDKFYLFPDDGSRNGQVIGPDVMTGNGHGSYLPLSDNEWILNDSYPDENRLQHIYLYHVPTGTRVPLANVYMHPKYRFDWECRVDTHPRFSPDGMGVVIDSAHDGEGRQMYLLDISGIVGKKKLF